MFMNICHDHILELYLLFVFVSVLSSSFFNNVLNMHEWQKETLYFSCYQHMCTLLLWHLLLASRIDNGQSTFMLQGFFCKI
jgi:ABC-type multidrug transport system permease subunit